VLLRLDPEVHNSLARWAGDEFRSTNAQIEFVLRRALVEAGRLPSVRLPRPRVQSDEWRRARRITAFVAERL